MSTTAFILLTAWIVVVVMWLLNYWHRENTHREMEYKRKRFEEAKRMAAAAQQGRT